MYLTKVPFAGIISFSETLEWLHESGHLARASIHLAECVVNG